MTFSLFHGDCRDVMRTLEADSVDSIVTDPPYGLSFMGKGWDHGVPGAEFWVEALRVAKPGAHLLAFGGTRTFHRLAVAIEDAGWEIRDTVMWVYGSGFPKSHNISKAIDREAGAEREPILDKDGNQVWTSQKQGKKSMFDGGKERPATYPATYPAKQWDGWGTALKPAWEPIIVARKPISGTVAENIVRYGTGGINVDGCRVEYNGETPNIGGRANHTRRDGYGFKTMKDNAVANTLGRWPANLIHDGSDEVLGLFPNTKSGTGAIRKVAQGLFGLGGDGKANIEYGDSGSAARFFYCAKASKADRDEGLEGFELKQTTGGGGTNDPNGDDVCGKYGSVKSPARNHHPTVKPTALMRYLCKLVTQPGGTVLDPFMGSGSTGKAAMLEGFNFIGIEQDEEYIKIAEARIDMGVLL